MVADALSRQPLEALRRIVTHDEAAGCDWYDKQLQEVREQPEKHPDYNIVNDQLYRHIQSRFRTEESPVWKLFVPMW